MSTAHLLDALLHAGRRDRAEQVARELLKSHRSAKTPDPSDRQGTHLTLVGQAFLAAGKPGEAEPPLREGLAIREKSRPDEWRTFDSRSCLGEALARQGKDDEAEPLLKQGYEGLKKRASLLPAPDRERLPAARRRLVAFYEGRGRAAEADRWRRDRGGS